MVIGSLYNTRNLNQPRHGTLTCAVPNTVFVSVIDCWFPRIKHHGSISGSPLADAMAFKFPALDIGLAYGVIYNCNVLMQLCSTLWTRNPTVPSPWHTPNVTQIRVHFGLQSCLISKAFCFVLWLLTDVQHLPNGWLYACTHFKTSFENAPKSAYYFAAKAG